MLIAEWVEREGRGALTRLMRRSGLAWDTINRVVRDGRAGQTRTARLISAATDGEVPADTLLGESEDEPAPEAKP